MLHDATINPLHDQNHQKFSCFYRFGHHSLHQETFFMPMLTLISYFSSSWNMYFIKLFTSRNMHLTRHVSVIIFRKDDFAGHKQPPWPSPIPLVMQAFTNSKYSGGQLFLLFVEIVILKCFQQTLPNLNKLERTVYIIFLDPTSTPGFPLSNPDSALLCLARSIQLPLIRFLRYPGLDAPP